MFLATKNEHSEAVCTVIENAAVYNPSYHDEEKQLFIHECKQFLIWLSLYIFIIII